MALAAKGVNIAGDPSLLPLGARSLIDDEQHGNGGERNGAGKHNAQGDPLPRVMLRRPVHGLVRKISATCMIGQRKGR
jgi:hypothetical protein